MRGPRFLQGQQLSPAPGWHAAALQSKPPSAGVQGCRCSTGEALSTWPSVTASALTTALSHAGAKLKHSMLKNRSKALLEVTVTTKTKVLLSLSGWKTNTFVTRTLAALLTYSINVSPCYAKAVAQLSFSDKYCNDFNLYIVRRSLTLEQRIYTDLLRSTVNHGPGTLSKCTGPGQAPRHNAWAPRGLLQPKQSQALLAQSLNWFSLQFPK